MNNLFSISFILIVIITIALSIFGYTASYDYALYNINPEDIFVSDTRLCLANS